MTTIVLKLVNIVNRDCMYMGEKDYQQIAVLKRMLLDLNSHTRIVPCEIVRKSDGLAMSSRNKYLDEKQRQDALCLRKAIDLAQKKVAQGCRKVTDILPELKALIKQHNGKLDYLEFRNDYDLNKTDEINKHTRIFIAVYIGSTRLIDNANLTHLVK